MFRKKANTLVSRGQNASVRTAGRVELDCEGLARLAEESGLFPREPLKVLELGELARAGCIVLRPVLCKDCPFTNPATCRIG